MNNREIKREKILTGLLQGKNKKTIAREVGVSRTTVHKVSEQPFFLTLTESQKEQLRRIQDNVFELLEELPIEIKDKLNRLNEYIKDNPGDLQTQQTYNKFLNTAINYIDKTNRTLDSHKPSKQISIEDYTNRKLIQITADTD